jgi:hypothetical protein
MRTLLLGHEIVSKKTDRYLILIRAFSNPLLVCFIPPKSFALMFQFFCSYVPVLDFQAIMKYVLKSTKHKKRWA